MMKKLMNIAAAMLPLVIGVGGVGTALPTAQAQVRMQHQTTLEGRLTQVVAIGAETTGWAIQTARGQYEVDLPRGLHGEAARYEGRRVRVQGVWTTLFGPERGPRRVLRVQALWPVHVQRPDGRWFDGRPDGRRRDGRWRGPGDPRQRYYYRPPARWPQPVSPGFPPYRISDRYRWR